MMREILFRGKRVDNGEWIEGYYVKACHHWHEHGIHEDWIVSGASSNGGWFVIHERRAVDPSTVGQYTGLTDKNGKRIFEGDIVRCVARIDETNCVVIFEEGEFRLVSEKWYKTYVTGGGYHALRCFQKEVIGNIHDNPELMEEV